MLNVGIACWQDVFPTFDAKLVAMVHDSLEIDVEEKYAEACIEQTVRVIEDVGEKYLGDELFFTGEGEYGTHWGRPVKEYVNHEWSIVR
jgi:hypothetical protein